jgi:hypothetical protein
MPGSTVPVALVEWQVQTKDSVGQWSPWSASRFVNTTAGAPDPTITAPAAAAVITASPVLVTWDIPAGFPQNAYRVLLRDNPFTDYYYDSGTVQSAAQSVLADVAAPLGELVISVTFYYGPVGAQGSVTVTNAIKPPMTPLLICEQVPDKPEVTISITNPPASDANHLATLTNDLTRNGVPIATGLPVNATFTDRLVGAGEVDYRAVAVTANGGTATSF